MAYAAKLCEGIEEMIVTGYPWRRNKPAHRKGVNQRVIKLLATLGMRITSGHIDGSLTVVRVGDRDSIASAGLFALRFRKREGSEVHAEMVLRGRADPGFRVDGAAQVIV